MQLVNAILRGWELMISKVRAFFVRLKRVYCCTVELIEQKLGFTISKEDEMECMIRGCNFLLK